MLQAPPEPTEAEVMEYFTSCSNWGRWGTDDSAGTINLVTPEKRREAAALVRSGRAVSLSHPWAHTAGPGNGTPAMHYTRVTKEVSGDFIGAFYHGFMTTHIDALCHLFWEGKMYNGKPAADVTSLGARSNAVNAWSDGIATRGVLLDVPRFRGVPHVTLDAPVRGWELDAVAKAQGVEVRPGDAVVVFSGRDSYYAAHPDRLDSPKRPGLHVDTVPSFKRHDVAMVVWDMQDAASPHRLGQESRPAGGPVHIFAIVFMGMPLLDNARLEPLAAACAEEGRWEFMLTVNPLVVRGGTGSPVNPVALF